MTLPDLPAQPAGVPWPTQAWPVGDPPAAIAEALDQTLSRGFADTETLGKTHAVLVVHKGALVRERYAPGFDADTTQPSWSMAKSITQALVGLAVGDGLIDVMAPADVPEWRGAGDPRGAITLDQLLRMSSGLAWREEYDRANPSDVIEMLFGAAKADVAGFAAAAPLAHPPGAHFYYSSGTTNLVSRCVARAVGQSGAGFEAYMRQRLFAPLGMTSATPKFDDAGTFIGSSYCFCTPRDFARFGLLYLRGGIWDGARLLDAGWIDYARTPTFQQAGGDIDGPYGAHWWLDRAGPGAFSANGFGGQAIVLSPRQDLIIVRNGETPERLAPALRAWIAGLAALFP